MPMPAFIARKRPLAELTTFGAGGLADYFATVTSESQAIEALDFARGENLPVFVLGGGSNVLISDEGFPGLVIHNRIRHFAPVVEGDSVSVKAGGGEDWQEFTDRCVAMGWQGLECLAGVPGTVGAAPVQNIGAYGQEVSQTITSVRAVGIATGLITTFSREECGFAYRKSIFNTVATGSYLITAVTFNLTEHGAPLISYRELADHLADTPSPTLADVRQAVLDLREGKGLLVREGFEGFKSAGSFFRNPVVTQDEYDRIAALVAARGGCSNWAWPQKGGSVKLSAACLIQSAGFTKGFRLGEVGISPRHTLIIINYGKATATDIVDFAGMVQQRVLETFGVFLSPEVRLIGFKPGKLKERQ